MLFYARHPNLRAAAIATFCKTSCCYAAKNLPPTRCRPLLISFPSWRLLILGSLFGHAMRSVIVTGGSKGDMADAVEFLLSHGARKITGTVMTKDTGSAV